MHCGPLPTRKYSRLANWCACMPFRSCLLCKRCARVWRLRMPSWGLCWQRGSQRLCTCKSPPPGATAWLPLLQLATPPVLSRRVPFLFGRLANFQGPWIAQVQAPAVSPVWLGQADQPCRRCRPTEGHLSHRSELPQSLLACLQVVRQVLVAPAVQGALQKAAASRPPGAAAGSEGLAVVLPPVLEAVLDRHAPARSCCRPLESRWN